MLALNLVHITGINPEAVKWGDDRYDRPLCPGLPRPSQSNPRGSGPEVLKRERGHVTAETGVAEVAVFGALQPNVLAKGAQGGCEAQRPIQGMSH